MEHRTPSDVLTFAQDSNVEMVDFRLAKKSTWQNEGRR